MSKFDQTQSVWANLGTDGDRALYRNEEASHPLGYAQNLNKDQAQELMRDPKFVQDLVDFYGERDGKQFSTVEEAVEYFFTDRSWRNNNSVSLGKDLYDVNTMSTEQGQRLGRIQSVYDAFPNFYEEGGRGLSGLGTNLAATLLDPVNLVGFGSGAVAAKTAAQTARYAQREAMKAGVEYTGQSATRAGITAGAKRGALVEMPVSGAITGAFDAATQSRNVELGLQDEVSGAQVAASTGLGAVIGGAAGGLFGAAGAVARNPLRQGSQSAIQQGVAAGDEAFARDVAEAAAREADEAAAKAANIKPDASNPSTFEDSSLTTAFDDFQDHLKRELDDAIDQGLPSTASSQDVATVSYNAAAGRGTGIEAADRIAATLGIFRSIRTAPIRLAAMRSQATGLAATDPTKAATVLSHADALEGAYRRMSRHILGGAYDAAAREADSAREILRLIDETPDATAPAGALSSPDPNAPRSGPGGAGNFIFDPTQSQGPTTQPLRGGGAGPSQPNAGQPEPNSPIQPQGGQPADEVATATSAVDADAAPEGQPARAAEGADAGATAAEVAPQERLTQLDREYNAIRSRLDNLTRKEKAGSLSPEESTELTNLRGQRDQINAQKKEARQAVRAAERRLEDEVTQTAAPDGERARVRVADEPGSDDVSRGTDELLGDDPTLQGEEPIMRTAEDLAVEFGQSEKEAVDFLTRVLGYENSIRKDLRAATQGMTRSEAKAERLAFIARKVHEVRAGLQLNKVFRNLGGTSDYRVYIPEAVKALIRVEFPKDVELMSGLYDRWFQQQAPAIIDAMYRRLGSNAPLTEVMREIDVVMGRDVVQIVDDFFSGNPNVQRIEFDDVKLPNVNELPEEAQTAFAAVRTRMIEEGKARGWKPEFIQLALNQYVKSTLKGTKVVEFKGKKRLVDSQNLNPMVAGAHIGRKQEGISYGRNGEIVPRNAVGGLQSIIKPANYGPEDRPFFQRLFQVARGRDDEGNALRFSAEESASRAIEDAFVSMGTQRRRRDPLLVEQNAVNIKAIDDAKKAMYRRLTKKEQEEYEDLMAQMRVIVSAAEREDLMAALPADRQEIFRNVELNEKGTPYFLLPDEQARELYYRLVEAKNITGAVSVNRPSDAVSETLEAFNERIARDQFNATRTAAGMPASAEAPARFADPVASLPTREIIKVLNDERARLTSDVDVAVRGREVESRRTDGRRIAERIYARYTEAIRRRDQAPEGSPERAAINVQVKQLKAKISEADASFFEERKLKRAQRKALAEAKLAANNSDTPPTDAQIAEAVSREIGLPTTKEDLEVATSVADSVSRKVALAERKAAEQETVLTGFREHQDAARLTKELEDIQAKYKALEAATAPATKPVGRNDPLVVVHKGVEVDVKNNFRLRDLADGSFEVRFLGDPVATLRKMADGGFEVDPADSNMPVFEYNSVNHALRNLPVVFEDRIMIAHKQGLLVSADAPKNLTYKEPNWKDSNTYKGSKEEDKDAPSLDDLEGGRADKSLDVRISGIDVPKGRDVAIQILSGPLEGKVRVIPATREGFEKVSIRSVLGRQENQQFVVGHVESGVSGIRAQETFRPLKDGDSFLKFEAGASTKGRAKTHVYSSDADVINPEAQAIPYEQLASRVIDPEDMPQALRDQGGIKTFQDLHDAIINMENVPWNHPSLSTPEQYQRFIYTLNLLYSVQAKLAPHGIKYPNASRRGSMNQLSSILGGVNKQEVSAIFNVLRGLSSKGGVMPRFTGKPEGYFYTPPHAGLDPIERNAINLDVAAKNLQQPIFAKSVHEIGHWAYFNILTPDERATFWSAMGKYVTEEGADIAALKKRLPGSASNELHSPAEFFANQWTQWVISSGRAGDPVGLANLWRKVVRAFTAVMEKFFMGGQRADLIDPDLIPLFERIMPDIESNGMKYQAIAKKFAPSGGRIGIIAKKLDDYEILKGKIENAVRSGSPDEILATLAGDGSGSPNFVSEVYSLSGKRGTKFLRKKSDGTGGGRRIGLFDGGETIGQRANKNGDMTDAVSDPNGYFIRGKMLRLMFDIQRATAEMRKRQVDMESDAAQKELDALIATQLDGDDLGLPDMPAGARGMEDLALQNFGGDIGDLDLLANSAIEVLNEAQTGLRQQFRRAFPKTGAGEGLAILPDGTLLGTADSPTTNVFRKRAQARKAKLAKDSDAAVQELLKGADEALNESLFGAASVGEKVASRSPREMSMDELVSSMRAVGKKDERYAAYAAEIMRKINASPEITQNAKTTEAAAQFADRDNRSLLNGLMSAFEKGDTNRVTMIATELRVRQSRLGDKSDPFLLPKDSKVGRALQVEAAQAGGVPQGNGIPPDAPIAIKEALSKFSHRDKRTEFALRTMAYRMMNLMGRTEKDLLNNASFMRVEDVYRLAGMSAPEDARGAFSDMSRLEGEPFNQVRKNLRRFAIGLHGKTAKATPFDLMHEVGHMIVRATFDRQQIDLLVSQFNEALVKGERIATTIAAKYGATDAQRAAEEWFVEGWANYLGERVAKGDIWALRNGEAPLRFKSQLEAMVDRLIEFVAYVTNGLIGNNSVRQQFRRLTFYGDMFTSNKMTHPFKSAVNATNNASVVASLAPHYARDVLASMPEYKRALVREFVQAGPDDDMMDFVYYHGTPNGNAMERGALSPALQPSGPDALFGPGVYVIKGQAMGRYYSEAGHMSSIRKMIDESTDNPTRRQEGYEIAQIIVEKRNQLDELTREMSFNGYSEMTQRRAAKFMDVDGVDDELPFDDSAITLIQQQRRLQSLLKDERDMWKLLNQVTGANYNPKVLPLLVRATEPFDFRDSAFYTLNGDTNNVSWVVHWLSKNGYLSVDGAKNMMSRAPQDFSGSDFYDMLTQDAMLDGGLSMNASEAKIRLQAAMRDLGYDSFHVTEPGNTGLESHDALVLFDSNQVKHVDADVFDADRAGIYNSTMGNEFMGITHRLVEEIADENRLLNVNDFVGIGHEFQRLGMPDTMQRVIKKMTRKEELSSDDIDTSRRYGVGNILRENSSTLRRMGAHWFADKIKGEGGPSIFDRHSSDLAARINPLLTELRALPDAKNMLGRWLRNAAFAGSVVGGAKVGALAGSAVAPGIGTLLGTVGGMAAGAYATRFVNIPQPKSHERILRAMREGRQAMSRLKPEERAVAEKIQAAFREELTELRRLGIPVGDVTQRGITDTYVPQLWNAEAIRENPNRFLKNLQNYFMRESRMAGEPMTGRDAGEVARRIFDKILDTDGHLAADSVIHETFSNPFYQRFINLRAGDIADFDEFMTSDLEGLLTRYYNKTVRKRTLAKDFGVGGHAFNAYRAVAELGREAAIKILMTDKNVFVNRREFFNSAEVENLIVPSIRKSREEVEALVESVVSMLGDTRASAQQNKQKAKDLLLAEMSLNNVDDGQFHNYRLRVDAIVNGLADFKRPTQARDLVFMDKMVNVLNQRPVDGTDGTGLIYAASRNLRSFNSVTLLGFATLTSLPDTVLPLVRSGNFRAWAKGMQQWYRMEPSYRNAVRDIGVGVENLLHDRMVQMSGDGSQRFANSFFNLTLLTPWTNMQREVAALVGFNALKTEVEIARKYAQAGKTESMRYKTAIRFLERYGLAGENMIEGGIDFSTQFAPRLDDIQTYAKNPQVRYAVMRFTNEAVFTPDPNDVPLWAQTPWGAIVFQLKSFPVMMGRMAKYVIDEAYKGGNVLPLSYMLTAGAGFGMGALAIKDMVQSRGGEDERSRELRLRTVDKTAIGQGLMAMGLVEKDDYADEQQLMAWYLDGLMAFGGLGFVGELFFNSAAQVDNGNFGFNRLLGTLVGPSYDAAYTGFQAAAATQEILFGDGENPGQVRAGLRAVASRVPVLGGDRDFRESMADIGGPARQRGTGDKGNPDSFGRSGAFKAAGFGKAGEF